MIILQWRCIEEFYKTGRKYTHDNGLIRCRYSLSQDFSRTFPDGVIFEQSGVKAEERFPVVCYDEAGGLSFI